jgi:hypothetical protein
LKRAWSANFKIGDSIFYLILRKSGKISNIKIAEIWEKTAEIWEITAEIWEKTAEIWEKSAEIWDKSQISKVRKSGKITWKFGNFKICLRKSGKLSIAEIWQLIAEI